ncbi:MAG TPA: NAD(P)-dependent oxidoreductase [Thermoanaerobaculia bacterium]|nr:NAD(P)-dependent oxidoreductase [Thermoanaerobaculia bacterium]
MSKRGFECITPARDDFDSWRDRDLGHVVYAIGLTADFRQRPADTVRAHVCRVLDVLERARYQSFVYLSSTRLYSGAASADENAAFLVDPASPSDLYNASKVMGESLVLTLAGARARVVRLSNVYGPDWTSENFVTSLVRDAVQLQSVTIRTSADSSKDYISIDDAVSLILEVALRGQETIYNVASGIAVSNGELADALKNATGSAVAFVDGAPSVVFPRIDVTRIREELGANPRSILEDFPGLVSDYRKVVEA